ncbi:HMCN1 [Branchiostoma lanceolatum]|uniref:HMCN1 protein n=1 Tax=Branchiostoma lanceolatum TaxID=7740 RepID=A0A8K0ABG7_BRALA|nr:HMCN1 [Branchiostoma lanceolatum]
MSLLMLAAMGPTSQQWPCGVGPYTCVEVLLASWSEWQAWGRCAASCGGGLQSRRRTCSGPDPAGQHDTCFGQDRDFRACNLQVCPFWSEWSSWSICSAQAPCGKRRKSRQRTCLHAGAVDRDPACTGDVTQDGACPEFSCDAPARLFGGAQFGEGLVQMYDRVSGQWGHVTAVTWDRAAANVTCRQLGMESGGTALPSDVTDNFSPVVFNLTSCNGTERRLTECDHVFNDVAMTTSSYPGRRGTRVVCKVDGSWGPWAPWSSCSCTDSGQSSARLRTRQRSCTSPPPLHHGENCTGDAEETKPCVAPCPDTCAVLRRALFPRCENSEATDATCVCLRGNTSACAAVLPLWQGGPNGTHVTSAHSSAGDKILDLNFRIVSGVNWTDDFLNQNSSASLCLHWTLVTLLQEVYSNSTVSRQCHDIHVHQLRPAGGVQQQHSVPSVPRHPCPPAQASLTMSHMHNVTHPPVVAQLQEVYSNSTVSRQCHDIHVHQLRPQASLTMSHMHNVTHPPVVAQLQEVYSNSTVSRQCHDIHVLQLRPQASLTMSHMHNVTHPPVVAQLQEVYSNSTVSRQCHDIHVLQLRLAGGVQQQHSVPAVPRHPCPPAQASLTMSHMHNVTHPPVVAQLQEVYSNSTVSRQCHDIHVHQLRLAGGVQQQHSVPAVPRHPCPPAQASLTMSHMHNVTHPPVVAQLQEVYSNSTVSRQCHDIHVHQLRPQASLTMSHMHNVTHPPVVAQLQEVYSNSTVSRQCHDIHVLQLRLAGGVQQQHSVPAVPRHPCPPAQASLTMSHMHNVTHPPVVAQLQEVYSNSTVSRQCHDIHVLQLRPAGGVQQQHSVPSVPRHPCPPAQASLTMSHMHNVTHPPVVAQLQEVYSNSTVSRQCHDIHVLQLRLAGGVQQQHSVPAVPRHPCPPAQASLTMSHMHNVTHPPVVAQLQEVYSNSTVSRQCRDIHVHELRRGSVVVTVRFACRASAGGPQLASSIENILKNYVTSNNGKLRLFVLERASIKAHDVSPGEAAAQTDGPAPHVTTQAAVQQAPTEPPGGTRAPVNKGETTAVHAVTARYPTSPPQPFTQTTTTEQSHFAKEIHTYINTTKNINTSSTDYPTGYNSACNNAARYNSACNSTEGHNSACNNTDCPTRYNSAFNNTARYYSACNNTASYNSATYNPARNNSACNNTDYYNTTFH